jgi:hypothetical protein
MTARELEAAGVGALFLLAGLVWGAIVASNARRKKPPPKWHDVPPPRKPWTK